MTRPRSIVVIGAGHNGLVCAAYLARAGHHVRLIEARDALGGAASTITFAEAYKVSGLAHILYSLHPQICKDLKLAEAGYDPGVKIDTVILDPDGRHLSLDKDTVSGEGLSQQDCASYTAFKKEFRSYAHALEPLMMGKPPRLKDMDSKDKRVLAKTAWRLRFGLGAKSLTEFLRVGGINIYDVLNDEFHDPRLKAAIAMDAIMGHNMGPRTPTTVLTYLNRIQGERYGYPSIPTGGMAHVINALADSARHFGVKITTATRVNEITVTKGRVTGLLLDSGEQMEADMVISNADAKETFLNLIGTRELDTQFCHRIHKTRTQGVVAKLHFALKGLPEVNGLTGPQYGQRLLIAPDMTFIEHAFNHAKYGEYSKQPVMEITIPSIHDTSLAPDGHHVMSVNASYAPYGLKAGWEASRQGFIDRVIAVLNDYFIDFSSLIVATELFTPVDIEREYTINGGHWHHGEMSLDQLFMMRPVHGSAQYNTPIKGVFLCGATAHPGGGVTGMPGHNAAQRILSMQDTQL